MLPSPIKWGNFFSKKVKVCILLLAIASAGCVGPCVGQSGKRSLFNTEHTDIYFTKKTQNI